MHGSFISEKMNSEWARSKGKLFVSNDNNHDDRRKSDPKRARSRNKTIYSKARKFKENGYVWS